MEKFFPFALLLRLPVPQPLNHDKGFWHKAVYKEWAAWYPKDWRLPPEGMAATVSHHAARGSLSMVLCQNPMRLINEGVSFSLNT
jgi:hypothetical protein